MAKKSSVLYGVQPSPGEDFDRRSASRNYVPSPDLYEFGERVSTKEVSVSKKGTGKPAASVYSSFDPQVKSGKHSAHAEFQKKAQGITGKIHGHGHGGFGPKGSVGSLPGSKDIPGRQTKGFGAQVKFA
jgi:hypothetical protein